MMRVRYWKWRVSLVGISALLLIMGLVCLPDRVRASAVSSMADLTRNFETEFTSVFARAFALAQTEFHRDTRPNRAAQKPGSSSAPANPEIATTSSMPAEFDLSHRFGERSLLTEYRLGGHPDSVREIAAAMFGDHGAELDGFHNTLAGDSQIASNIRNSNQHLRGGAGGSSGGGGVSGVNGSGRSADYSVKGATGSSVGSDSGHLRTDPSHVSSAVSSRRTDETDRGLTTVALAVRSSQSNRRNGETIKISAHEASGAYGSPGETGTSSEGGRAGVAGTSGGAAHQAEAAYLAAHLPQPAHLINPAYLKMPAETLFRIQLIPVCLRFRPRLPARIRER